MKNRVGASAVKEVFESRAGQRGHSACGDNYLTNEVIVTVGNKEKRTPGGDCNASGIAEERRATNTIARSTGSATRAATSGQRGDGLGCNNDDADEVVKSVGDVDAARAVGSDACRIEKFGSRADAVGVS